MTLTEIRMTEFEIQLRFEFQSWPWLKLEWLNLKFS